MSTARLRETAKVLRERAEAATSGEWEVVGGGEYVQGPGILVAPDDGGVTSADAAYIAMMQPAVALTLADAMELEASLLEGLPALAGLLNVTMEHESGIKGYIKFAQKPDGQPHMHAESTSGLLRIADLILGGGQS